MTFRHKKRCIKKTGPDRLKHYRSLRCTKSTDIEIYPFRQLHLLDFWLLIFSTAGTIVDREGSRKISHASRRVLTKDAEPQVIILYAAAALSSKPPRILQRDFFRIRELTRSNVWVIRYKDHHHQFCSYLVMAQWCHSICFRSHNAGKFALSRIICFFWAIRASTDLKFSAL